MIKVSVVNSLCDNILQVFYNHPESSYFRALKTAKLIYRNFYYPVMSLYVQKCVSSSNAMHQFNAPQHARYRINMSLELKSKSWKGIIRNVITSLPEFGPSGYTRMLVIINHLTQMEIYLLCWQGTDLPKLVQLFLEHVVCKYRVWDNIPTDLGTQYISQCHTQICANLYTDHWRSRTVHPQTDWQTDVKITHRTSIYGPWATMSRTIVLCLYHMLNSLTR